MKNTDDAIRIAGEFMEELSALCQCFLPPLPRTAQSLQNSVKIRAYADDNGIHSLQKADYVAHQVEVHFNRQQFLGNSDRRCLSKMVSCLVFKSLWLTSTSPQIFARGSAAGVETLCRSLGKPTLSRQSSHSVMLLSWLLGTWHTFKETVLESRQA